MLQFSSEDFTWTRNGGSAECSDLGILAGMPNPAAFAIVSQKTGKRQEFYRQSNNQQDVQKYVTMNGGPQVAVTLFND